MLYCLESGSGGYDLLTLNFETAAQQRTAPCSQFSILHANAMSTMPKRNT